jgi:enterochelin esterase-like enzyme
MRGKFSPFPVNDKHSDPILSPRIRILHEMIQEAGQAALAEFWNEVEAHGTPIIEADADGSSFVTFLWRHESPAQNVSVIQDWGCDGIREHNMSRLPDSDVWYLTRRMRSDTRTTYQLSPSPSTDPSEPAPYQLDPLNSKIFTAYPSETGHDIQFSLLDLPEAPALPWRGSKSGNLGRVQLHQLFHDQRRLWVYMPPSPTKTPLPLLVVFDGRLYKELFKLPEMLDYLIGRELIPAVAAVMVDNPDRSELLCGPEFADRMSDQIMPWLRAAYPVTDDPRRNIVVGSSFGGLAAAYLGFRHPKIWGMVLSQTGWFRWHPDDDPEHHWFARQISASPKLPVRFWLQVGNLEQARMLDGGPSQLDANQHLRDVLQSKGYELSYYEYSGGHDASSLEFPLARALTEMLPQTLPTE